METTSEKISAQQSLDIITNMIQQAKGNVRRNSFYFLLWGWIIAAANLGMYTLIQIQYDYPYIVWLITLPAWLFSMYRGYQQGQVAKASTHLDKITSWLWISFGIIVFTMVAFGYKINFQLNPVVLLLSAIPTFISGVIIKFKPLMFSGISFWILGIISFLVPVEIQLIIGAFAMFCGYILPGYWLKNKHEK